MIPAPSLSICIFRSLAIASVWALAMLAPLAQSQEGFPEYDAERSVARNWNEAILAAISRDFARPTVHARNLFHTSVAMYDAWAIFDETADTYLLGKTHAGYTCDLTQDQRNALLDAADDIEAARQTALSYAMYRVVQHRFAESPGFGESGPGFDNLMAAMGHDPALTSTSLATGSAEALGNYIGNCIIEFGFVDGANEENNYLNMGYEPVNDPLNPAVPGSTGVNDPDRWQPLELDITIDQAGNETSSPPFLGANWGQVIPFSLSPDDLTNYSRDGVEYPVYHDPGPPALLRSSNPDAYKWASDLHNRRVSKFLSK